MINRDVLVTLYVLLLLFNVILCLFYMLIYPTDASHNLFIIRLLIIFEGKRPECTCREWLIMTPVWAILYIRQNSPSLMRQKFAFCIKVHWVLVHVGYHFNRPQVMQLYQRKFNFYWHSRVASGNGCGLWCAPCENDIVHCMHSDAHKIAKWRVKTLRSLTI